ncbi:hypothetical protein GCM10009772_43180 [Pseudonocardia alni subsp. carboxydivorans]|uniref:Uncharacterized protein n=1 Tax=Pseudonocardia alni subsp. carboxydivorans TaxID=415010 RepID=A0ABU9AAZ3_PSEA5
MTQEKCAQMKNDIRHLLVATPFVAVTTGIALTARNTLGEAAPLVLLVGFLVTLPALLALVALTDRLTSSRRTRIALSDRHGTGTDSRVPYAGALR